jgi:hypothetical protein
MFGEYVEAFAACGRGESETRALLAYYGVPLLLATDGGFIALTTEDQLVGTMQQQIDGMAQPPKLRPQRHSWFRTHRFERHVRPLPAGVFAPAR